MPKLEFKIQGMDCAEEIAVLKREIGPLVGGADSLAFDLLRGKMTVASATSSAEAIVTAVGRTGMKAEPWVRRPGTDVNFWARRGRQVMTIGSGGATLCGFVFHPFPQKIVNTSTAFSSGPLR